MTNLPYNEAIGYDITIGQIYHAMNLMVIKLPYDKFTMQ